jgi:hypothetical protein
MISLRKDSPRRISSEITKYSQVALEDAKIRSTLTKEISAQQAVLLNLHGLVEIKHEDTWQAAQPGDSLEAGAWLRTGVSPAQHCFSRTAARCRLARAASW